MLHVALFKTISVSVHINSQSFDHTLPSRSLMHCNTSALLPIITLRSPRPSQPRQRQIPCHQLFLNQLPPSDGLLLLHHRLPLLMHNHVRHVGLESLDFLRVIQLLCGLFGDIALVKVCKSGCRADERVRQTGAGELKRTFDDLEGISSVSDCE